MMTWDEDKILKLIKEAEEKMKFCYSPYSRIRVVAVVETDKGEFWGVNIENASYGLTVCAERVAIFNAVSNGARKFKRVLIFSPDVMPFPCGACLQVMSEFVGEDFEVIIAHKKETRRIEKYKFTELLPKRFEL